MAPRRRWTWPGEMATHGDLRARPTRRTVLVAGGTVVAAGLAGCDGAVDAVETGASAGKSGGRVFFKDSIGWVSADATGLTLAFLPELVSPQLRDAVVANDGVYPVLPFRDPMLEVRLALSDVPDDKDVPSDVKLTASLVRGVMVTYWNFEEPTPVVSFSRDGDGAWDKPGLDLVNMDGVIRKGGWAVGTVRANTIYEGYERRKENYYINAQFEISLS